jgi:L-amino acid N-acyltransferase
MSTTLRLAEARDIAAITAIYDAEVVTGTATFDLEIQGETPHRERIARQDPLRAVLVLADEQQVVVAWGALLDHSSRPGWRSTAEVTLYVHADYRGQGHGRAMLDGLIAYARSVELHALVARITSDNTTSVHLHTRCGFHITGTMPEVGRKFDRWLGVTYMHLLL